MPTFYDQPKIKQGVPICHIATYSAFPMYNFKKYIANFLKAYVKDENNNVQNSTTFSNYISNVPTENDEIMVSCDVTFLYMNFPIIGTLRIRENCVSNNDKFTMRMVISQKKFPYLVNLVLTTTHCTLNSQLYQQNDGVALGELGLSTTGS